MLDPFEIYIAGGKLTGWESATLERKKEDLTGSLQIELFGGYWPDKPLLAQAVRGAEITVFVGGQLAFTGTVDSRKDGGVPARDSAGRFASKGSGDQTGSAGAVKHNITATRYKITINARGKTKHLIGSSHFHPTAQISGAKTKPVMEELVKKHEIKLDWRAKVYDMDKIRFRDGALIYDELFRIANEYSYYLWENRDGTLRVQEGAGQEMGEPLILGDNILEFSAEQGEEHAVAEIEVKGQRIKKGMWGRAAVNRVKKIVDPWVRNKSKLSLQSYADATDEALERRAQFEADKRAAASKQVDLVVYHVQSRSGAPWDIGTLHYVEAPCVGLFDVLECIRLKYSVDAQKTLRTELQLAPPPGSGGGLSGGAATGVASLASGAVAAGAARGAGRRAQLGIEPAAGQWPDPWSPAEVELIDATGAAEESAPAEAAGIGSLAGATLKPMEIKP